MKGNLTRAWDLFQVGSNRGQGIVIAQMCDEVHLGVLRTTERQQM